MWVLVGGGGLVHHEGDGWGWWGCGGVIVVHKDLMSDV